jgi:hypothetical protein
VRKYGKTLYSGADHKWQYGACALHAGYLEAINTRTGCVILIAFPLQQWLHELASVLCYTYIVCLVITETEIAYCAVRAEYV